MAYSIQVEAALRSLKAVVLPLALLEMLGSSTISYGADARIGTAYSAKGTLTYQVFALQQKGEPVAQKPLHREFEVLVDGCSWQIRVVLVGNDSYDHFTYAYDGTNLIHLRNASGRRNVRRRSGWVGGSRDDYLCRRRIRMARVGFGLVI